MRLSSPLAALTILAACTLTVHADTIVPFDFNATLVGGTVSGIVDVDITKGQFTTVDFTATISGISHLFDTPAFNQGAVPSPATLYVGDFTDSSGDMFQIALPPTSLIGYTGSAVCSLVLSCNPTLDIPTVFIQAKTDIGSIASSGSLTPAAAATPEPSTFALLTTGILGLAGAARRKFNSRS
jgi:PEP-CTERM motif